MERMYANLHLHSTHSDGVYSPRELVAVAKEEGYRALAITDHDTASAYGELQKAAGVEGLEVHHADLTPEERARSLALCMEKGLFVSGGSDHSGLCGGLYGSYATREALEASHHFIPPLSAGVTEHHFRELQTRRLER